MSREWIDSTTGEIFLRNVLVAHDFSLYSQLALQYALILAQQYQAGLECLKPFKRADVGEVRRPTPLGFEVRAGYGRERLFPPAFLP